MTAMLFRVLDKMSRGHLSYTKNNTSPIDRNGITLGEAGLQPMKVDGAVVIFVTTSSHAEADKITAVLLEAKKAACVNIVPAVRSRYWWKGTIESAEEVLLIIKTKTSAAAAVIELVKKNHSYSVPEIIALPIVAGNEDYLKWIDESVAD